MHNKNLPLPRSSAAAAPAPSPLFGASEREACGACYGIRVSPSLPPQAAPGRPDVRVGLMMAERSVRIGDHSDDRAEREIGSNWLDSC